MVHSLIQHNHKGNILIVGGGSFIAQSLCPALEQLNWQCFNTRKLPSADPKVIIYDLTKPEEISLDANTFFEKVIWCAAQSNISFCNENPAFSKLVNQTSVERFIHLYNQSIGEFIYLSSDQVFNGDVEKPEPQSEKNPKNNYGIQKSNVEEFLKYNFEAYKIVRLTKVVDNVPFLSHVLKRAMQGQSIEVFDNYYVNPISREYIVNAIIDVAINRSSGIYHFSGDQDFSYYDLSRALAEMRNIPSDLIIPKTADPDDLPIGCKRYIALGMVDDVDITGYKGLLSLQNFTGVTNEF